MKIKIFTNFALIAIYIVLFFKTDANSADPLDIDVRRLAIAADYNSFNTIMSCYQLRTDSLVKNLSNKKTDSEFEVAIIDAGGYENLALEAIQYCNRRIRRAEVLENDDPLFFEASDVLRRAMRLLDKRLVEGCVTSICKQTALETFILNASKPTPKD